ncbi:MAG: Sheath polysaccharide-degrading enzyme, partial [Candidatus Giovannonibacteria bacterium GW2011_GWA1_44_25]
MSKHTRTFGCLYLFFVISIGFFIFLPLAVSADITTGLVGHWKFDEGSGTVASDSSGNVNNGALTSGPTWTTGKVSGALSFDGVDARVSIPDRNIHEFNEGTNGTISFWFKLLSYPSSVDGHLVDKYDSSVGQGGYLYRITDTDGDGVRDDFRAFIHGTTNCNGCGSNVNKTNISLNQWYHAVSVIKTTSNSSELYIDGALISSTGNFFGAATSTQTLSIGGNEAASNVNAVIDDARIYNRVLTAADITELYNLGSTAFDFSLTNGGNKSVTQGSSVNNTVTATLVSGTAQAVSFITASGLPTGAAATFSPISCTPSTACSTVLTISALSTTPAGTYTITVTGTATGGTIAPSIPTGLTATAISSSQINLSWTASTDNVGVAGYKVFRGGVQIATVTTGTSYSNTGLTAATTYSYTVSAYDAAGLNSAQSASVSVTTLATGAKTYYVATTGNDANTGTSAAPFKTIQKAADVVQAGDRVIVKAGTYYGRILMKTSGTASAPIVFEGEAGAIIDGSEPTSGWVTAPEIGPGVYKTTNIPYNPYAMIADGDKNIAKIHDVNMQTNKYVNWQNLLKTPVDATEQTFCGGNPFVTIKSWDGVEAYFGYLSGTTYIRFKNGDNPITRNLRSSPGPNGCGNCWPMSAAVRIEDKSYVIVKNFLIRGAQWGITLKGSNAANNLIEGNHIMNGLGRVYIALGAHDNVVRGNKMELNQLGFEKYPPGADSVAASGCNTTAYPDPYAIGVKSRYYFIFKYIVGDSSENNADSGVKIRSSAGANNDIVGNEIFNGIVGMDIAETTGGRVHNNTIHNMAAEGIFILNNVRDLQIYDNLLYDSDINIRPQHMNEGNRLVYIYRNRIYNPHLLGAENFYFHFWPDSPPPSSYPEFFIYHNSIVGGHIAFGVGDAVPAGGMPGVRFINNIFSSYQFYTPWMDSAFTTNSSMVGAFDYNWAGGIYARGVPAWFGSNNINARDQKMWNVTTMPDFKLPAGSLAIDKGID